MPRTNHTSNGRILIIDDNEAIHEDFRKIFALNYLPSPKLDLCESTLFGDSKPDKTPAFEVDSAFQGEEGLALVQQARQKGSPYMVAFVDVRMPPGWDGVETTAKLWEEDPDLQVVICTAYSDYSLEDLITKLGYTDRLLILKKPFDRIEVQQLATALTAKWRLVQQSKERMADLDALVADRARALRNSETNYRLLVERSPDAILVHQEGKLVYVNPSGLTLLRAKEQGQLLGREVWEIVPPNDRDLIRARIQEAATGGTAPLLEERLLRLDGTTIDVEAISIPFSYEAKPAVQTVVRDITERKRVEEARARLAQQLQLLLESTGEGIYGIDLDGCCTFINQAGAAMLGHEQGMVLGKNVHQVLHHHKSDGSPYPSSECPIFRSFKAGERCRVDTEVFWRRDGTAFPVDYSTYPVLEDGNITGAVVAFTDITERKKLEKELAIREQRLNSFFNNAAAGLCIVNAGLRYVQINETLAQINGLTITQHIGKTIREVLPNLAPLLEPYLHRVLSGGESVFNMEVSGETVARPGEIRHWMVSYFPIPGEDARPVDVGSVVVEVTERKRAEDALHESEEKFRQLAEHIHKVFWICDKDLQKMLYVSPAYEQIWGRSCQSLYEHPRSFAEAIHPDDRERIMASLKKEKLGEDYEEEYRIVRPDGSVRWIHIRSFQVRNENGEFYRLAGLAEDITERRQLEEQLRQAQKMEAIGQLAGGVAHDFNNILAAILMHLGLLQQNPQVTIGTKESLKEVESETMRAANLTRQLLSFSRRQIARVQPLDLRALIDDLLKMLRRLLGENIEIDFRSYPGSVWVEADAGMLEQVVTNLCVNARDAMPNGGRLTLGAELVERDAQSTISHPDARPGHFACFAVTDTGCGMEETVLTRIFEPFFTTKEVGKGTGLGLATVYGIVKQHEGWIEVESTVGKGSSFHIYFPALTKPAEKAAAPERAEAVQGGSETILLVEDDLTLRRMGALCLRKLGYAVLDAATGLEALALWKQHHRDIQLLLTDMVLPGTMNGLDLAKKLRTEKAGLRIIISSGYSTDFMKRPHLLDPEIGFLAKPFQAATLAKIVRQCLDKV